MRKLIIPALMLAAAPAAAQTLTGTVAGPVVILQDPVPEAVVVTELSDAAPLVVSGCGADGWCRVESDGATGWVRADAVTMIQGEQRFVLANPPAGTLLGEVDANGNIIGPPPGVRTYVVDNPLTSITWSGDIAMGDTLPDTVVLTPVPETTYRYVYVDDVPVVVDDGNRVVAVLR